MGGGGNAVRNGLPEGSRKGSGAEEAVALLQREEISPSLPSTALSATCRPFFSLLLLRRDARITFRRRRVRACVLAGTEENPVLRLFTWSFPVPRDHSFSSNRMQPGCALCFFAVGGRKRGGGGER